MSHTIREKQKLINRSKRIRGQLEAIERALESELGCEQVMHLIAGCRGAVNGLLNEVVEDHVRTHLADRNAVDDPNGDAIEQLVGLLRTYYK